MIALRVPICQMSWQLLASRLCREECKRAVSCKEQASTGREVGQGACDRRAGRPAVSRAEQDSNGFRIGTARESVASVNVVAAGSISRWTGGGRRKLEQVYNNRRRRSC